jgi:subtilase family serine protease/subtilisin family serine protease
MRATPNLLVAVAVALLSGGAVAGIVHPDLEARLANSPRDALVPVIVELTAKADPKAAAKKAGGAHRRARTQAVVETLRDVAARTQPAVKAHLQREQASGGVHKFRPFWVFNGFAVTAKESVIRKLAARSDVSVVRFDAPVPPPKPRPTAKAVSSADPAWNIEVIRAPEVWVLGPGYAGAGVVIGSFDTGVDGTHPDLAPRYRGNHAISWFDPYGQHASPYDGIGHGTHTVGTMVGGDLSGYSIGVAPDARWIAAKGWNDADDATESAFHEIFEWFLAPGGDPANAPDVVNSSWGLDPPLCFPDFRADVQALRAAGIVPVFASGNSGPDSGTVLAPGSYPESFTVGATDPFDDISIFSSQGPSPCDGATKPNISAPGEFILSTWLDGDYAYLDGTSMATPHVTGAAAVLLSIDPTLTVDEVEEALAAGSVDLGPPGPDDAFGAGRLDLMESARLVLGLEKVGIVATTATAYELGTVAGVFTVTRSGPTTDPHTVTYTVSGSATPGSDYVVLPGSVTIPAGAASATVVVTPVDDSIFEHDETVSVILDSSPDYVASPRAATVTIVSDELPPDLVIFSMTAPGTAGAGASFTITDTTKNQGTGAAQASSTRFYLSSNLSLDASDMLLGARAVPALAAGASNSGSTTVAIPAGTASGTYYLFAKADDENAVVEDNEANNFSATTLIIGADLVVYTFTVPSDAGAGLAITLSDTTKNQGAGTAAASTTTYYLSANAVLDSGDVVLGSRAVPALGSGVSDAGSLAVTIPAGTATGTYYVFAKADAGEVVSETSEFNNTAVRTLRVGPDLLVTSLSAPSTAGAGTTISVTDTTRNQGGGASPASNTRYYLSVNNILDGGDVLLGSRAVAALAPATSNTGSVTLTIPASTAGASYYLLAKADGDDALVETQEGNNVFLTTIVVGGDLVVTSLTAPADAGAGLSITVTDTTKNQGAGTVAPSTTTYYLSTNTLLDGADVVLGSRAVPALASGVSDTGSAVVTIPAGTGTGTYYVFAKADAADAVSETVETNNTTYRTLRVGPDLLVTSLNAPAAAGAGASFAVTDTTRNQGGGASPASSTRYYLSSNLSLDSGDTLLGSRAVAALAPGSSDTGSATLTIPAATPAGTYYLFAKADGDDALVETQESNNSYAVTVTIGADLVVYTFTVPSDAGAGLAITLSDTTKNQGAGTAAASTTTYYLSANAALDSGDVVLGSRVVPALGSGVSDTGSVMVTIPAGTATGTYYVFAKADAGEVVSETSEFNNTAVRTLRVGPDLLVTSLSAPSTAGAGTTISVTDTTRNQGGGASPASSTRYYLSVNNLLDGADLLLGARAVAALSPATSDTGSVALTIPAGIAGGTYYLLAKADGDDALAETQEGNNVFLTTIVVGGDLVVTSFTGPTDGGAGLPVTFTDTTKNQGAGTVAPSTTTYYLSANTLLDGADVVLGSRAVPALGGGVSDTGSVTVTIPAGTATGTYYVFAKADAGDAVSETVETNNTTYRTLRVGPDLLIASFSAPWASGAGATISVTDTTRNQGGGASPASSTRYYLSSNLALDSGDTLLGSRAVAALAPGASDAGSVALTIPLGIPAGTYYLFAKADGDDAVTENNEGNNLYGTTLIIGADLAVLNFTVPAEAGAGASITLTDTTKNQGAGASEASTTTYYLSANATLDGADLVLGSRAVPALGSGVSDTGSVSVAIPAGTPAGTYYVYAKADAGAVVSETSEFNNTIVRTLRIVP